MRLRWNDRIGVGHRTPSALAVHALTKAVNAKKGREGKSGDSQDASLAESNRKIAVDHFEFDLDRVPLSGNGPLCARRVAFARHP